MAIHHNFSIFLFSFLFPLPKFMYFSMQQTWFLKCKRHHSKCLFRWKSFLLSFSCSLSSFAFYFFFPCRSTELRWKFPCWLEFDWIRSGILISVYACALLLRVNKRGNQIGFLNFKTKFEAFKLFECSDELAQGNRTFFDK